jgi:hypothetical protein
VPAIVVGLDDLIDVCTSWRRLRGRSWFSCPGGIRTEDGEAGV